VIFFTNLVDVDACANFIISLVCLKKVICFASDWLAYRLIWPFCQSASALWHQLRKSTEIWPHFNFPCYFTPLAISNGLADAAHKFSLNAIFAFGWVTFFISHVANSYLWPACALRAHPARDRVNLISTSITNLFGLCMGGRVSTFYCALTDLMITNPAHGRLQLEKAAGVDYGSKRT
jgi:hypothetical protein